jgi:hypothetical protein
MSSRKIADREIAEKLREKPGRGTRERMIRGEVVK